MCSQSCQTRNEAEWAQTIVSLSRSNHVERDAAKKIVSMHAVRARRTRQGVV